MRKALLTPPAKGFSLYSVVCETAKKQQKNNQKAKKQTNKQTIKGQSVTQAEAPPGASPLSSSNWEGDRARGEGAI